MIGEKKEFVCQLVGDERFKETEEARDILDEAGVPYRFMHEWNGGRYGLHLYYGGLNLCIGLSSIAGFCTRYKHRHSLEKPVKG